MGGTPIYADLDPFGHIGVPQCRSHFPRDRRILNLSYLANVFGSIMNRTRSGLGLRIRVAGAAASSPRRASLFGGTDRVDWALCFVSFATLLSVQWARTQFQQGTMVAILLFISPWLWVAARNPNATIGSLLSNWPVLALPLFALLSTAWSEVPGWTLRAGTQYLVTAIIGVLAGSCVKPRTMLSALFSTLAFVTALGLLAGVKEIRGDEVTLVGLFGSKNYFGYSVGLLLLTATIVAFDRSRPGIVRLIAFAAAAVSPVLLVLSRSTGALIFSIAAIAVTCLLAFVARFALAFRFASLLLMAFLVVLFLIVWLYVGDFTAVLNSLGKDVTLTGRTWMWEWADMAIEKRPMLGVGYQAYWQPGNWGAEEIWAHDLKPDKSGYHFHNTFRQVTVDLGYVGLSVLLATIVAICGRIASCLLFSRPEAQQIFAIAAFLFVLFRFPLEVDLFWQFQIPTVILSLIWVYLGRPLRRRSRKPPFRAFRYAP